MLLWLLFFFDYFLAPNQGVFCDRNQKGKDVSFRAFLDYSTSYLDFLNPNGLFQQTVSGFTQYHWTYEKEFSTLSSVSYEYTELSKLILLFHCTTDFFSRVTWSVFLRLIYNIFKRVFMRKINFLLFCQYLLSKAVDFKSFTSLLTLLFQVCLTF